jgi:SAM-dependent methyltransferase
MNTKKIDYSSAYNDFWSRKDRAGSESYEDRDHLVELIISTVGYGRVLDVGCGEGKLVRALVERGVDAYGIDVSSVAIERANQYCPDRFQCASVIDLPFRDKDFDAIISTDCLEHIHPEDVLIAVSELRRICKQFAFFTIATTNDRDGHWHLTVKPREWWEQKFFDAGFIRHPDYYKINSLSHILSQPWQITLPLTTLNRDLTPGNLAPRFLSECSAIADCRLSCYTDLLPLSRPGDVVFHIGPQSTDFALLLNLSSEVSEVHVFLAKELFAKCSPNDDMAGTIHIHNLDELQNELSKYAGRINLAILESTTSINSPNLIREEVLVPGSRVIVITSTNDAQAAIAPTSLGQQFKIEEVRKIEFASQSLTCHVFLSSFFAGDQRFIPSIHGYESPPANLINFSRDYSNPWIPQNLVIPGIRTNNKDVLIHESTLILNNPNLRFTPDFGAALCVLGYRLLENDANASSVTDFIAKIEDHLESNQPQISNPHLFRWIVSLEYLMAQLFLKVGAIESALETYKSIVKKDVLSFSPTLMTKVISSYIAIGNISLGFHRIEDASAAYENGARSGLDALSASCDEWIGKWELPIKGAMYEAIQIADLANISLLKLRALRLGSKSGYPRLRVFQESSSSLFAINKQRYAIIEKQNLRLAELSSALQTQANMLDDRWSIMQSMEASIRDRDEAIEAQSRMLEDRWVVMQSMESLIRDRDQAIAAQARMLEERWTAMQSFEVLIRDRDEVIFKQQQILENPPKIKEAVRRLIAAIIASVRFRSGQVLGKLR